MGIGARIDYVDSNGYMLPAPVAGQFVGCMSSELPCSATLGSPPVSRTLAASLYVMGSLGAPAVQASAATVTASASGNSTFASSVVGIIVITVVVACCVGCCALALLLICCYGFAVPGVCCLRSIFAPPMAKVTFPLSTGTVPPWLPFASDSVLRWQLVQGKLPAVLSPFEVGVGVDGLSEYVARTRLADGSLRIGRVSRGAAFKHGCHVACEYPSSQGVPHSCADPTLYADPSKVISVDTFEVLLGAAPGFDLRILPWPPGQLPPPGAVVAGVSARGDPLLAAVAAIDLGGRRCVCTGYASVRDGLVVVAVGDGVRELRW